jgi:hypothetical protein
LTFGFIGLFLEPCLLALSYALIREWSGSTWRCRTMAMQERWAGRITPDAAPLWSMN